MLNLLILKSGIHLHSIEWNLKLDFPNFCLILTPNLYVNLLSSFYYRSYFYETVNINQKSNIYEIASRLRESLRGTHKYHINI